MIGKGGGEDSGSAYLYKFDPSDSSWVETKLIASDGAANDYFGYSVSISGDSALVGAYSDDDNGDRSGSAYLYKFDPLDSSWVETKLTAPDGAESDYFGSSVSISGNSALVGAWGNDGDDDDELGSGSAYTINVE